MNKPASIIKRGAAAVVMAGLLATALPATAMAATVVDGDSTQSIVKQWNAAANEQLNNTEIFNFHVAYNKSDSVPAGTISLQDFGNWTNDVTLTSDWKDNAVNGGASSQATLSLSSLFTKNGQQLDFTVPGSYVFDVTELEGNTPGISYDTTSRYKVIVNVQWILDKITNHPTQNTEIESVVIRDASKQESDEGYKPATAFFNNNADVSENALTVTKKVAGTAANTADDFTFSVTLKGLTPGASYTGTTNDKNESYTFVASEGGIAVLDNVSLHDSETLTVANLPTGASWIVSESSTNYKQSYTVTGTNDTSSEETADNTAMSTTEHELADAHEVTFTNTKGFASQTGITMNTLPFVAVAAVAVAGGVTLVITRARRAHEDF